LFVHDNASDFAPELFNNFILTLLSLFSPFLFDGSGAAVLFLRIFPLFHKLCRPDVMVTAVSLYFDLLLKTILIQFNVLSLSLLVLRLLLVETGYLALYS
jgi:hypothetical protein